MSWLNSEFWFDDRRATLVIAPANREMHRALLAVANDAGTSPEAAEDILRQFIINTRPDLESLCICFLRFDFAEAVWEVGARHPTFGRVAIGGQAPRIELTGKEPTDGNTV